MLAVIEPENDVDGAASDDIEEVASSASGLQNLGNGYYQLSWKTDKKLKLFNFR